MTREELKKLLLEVSPGFRWQTQAFDRATVMASVDVPTHARLFATWSDPELSISLEIGHYCISHLVVPHHPKKAVFERRVRRGVEEVLWIADHRLTRLTQKLILVTSKIPTKKRA